MAEGAPRTTESLSGEAQAVLYIVGAAGERTSLLPLYFLLVQPGTRTPAVVTV
jgi:hypothetical protein